MAGPAGNMIFVGGTALLLRAGFLDELKNGYFIDMSMLLAVFNLIPGLPLDGGVVLRSVLAGFFPYKRSHRAACIAGEVLGLIAAGWGITGIFFGSLNLLPFTLGLYIFTEALRVQKDSKYVLLKGLGRKGRLLRGGEVYPVRVLRAREGASAARLLTRLDPGYITAVELINSEGRVVRTLTEDEIYRLAAEESERLSESKR